MSDATSALATAIPPNLAAVPPTGDQPTAIPATIAAPAIGTDMPTPMGTTPGTEVPASTDPETAAGAAHQSWLAHIIDTVGSILGGNQTLTVTKSPDGTIKVDHNPSTTGEKWGRVAAAALGGAAKGLAAGQGPGGAARAVAAGTEYGLQQPQQRLDQANQQAATMSAQQLRNAQNIALNQGIFTTGWNISHLPQEYAQKQATDAIAQAKEMDGLHAIPVAKGIRNGAEVAQYGKTDPTAVQAHVGTNGDMLYNIPDGKGGVDVWKIPANIGNQLTTDDDHWTQMILDPETGTKTIPKPQVTLAGQETVAQRASRRMATSIANDTAIKSAAAASSAAVTAGAAATRAAAAVTEAGQRAPLVAAQTSEAYGRGEEARANAVKARIGIPGGTTPAPAGTFDPAFPPSQNFPAGTEGIAPMPRSGGYKVPAQVSNRASLSRNIGENTDVAARIIQAQGDQLLGPVLGHVTSVEQMIGSNNPAISELGTRIHNIAMASVGIHGSRAVGNVHDQETNLLNHFRAGKDAALAALAANKDSSQTFLNEERNYQTYGTSTGPNRQAQTSSPPPSTNIRQQPATGYTAGVNTPQFPIAQNAQGHRQQWNGTTWQALP